MAKDDVGYDIPSAPSIVRYEGKRFIEDDIVNSKVKKPIYNVDEKTFSDGSNNNSM